MSKGVDELTAAKIGKHVYKAQKLQLEIGLLQAQIKAEADAIAKIAASVGVDIQTEMVVVDEGEQYPVGTVISRATGTPVMLPDPAEAETTASLRVVKAEAAE